MEIKMENFMNEPVDYDWTESDILKEYDKYQSKKVVAQRFLLTVKAVTEILKKHNS